MTTAQHRRLLLVASLAERLAAAGRQRDALAQEVEDLKAQLELAQLGNQVIQERLDQIWRSWREAEAKYEAAAQADKARVAQLEHLLEAGNRANDQVRMSNAGMRDRIDQLVDQVAMLRAGLESAGEALSRGAEENERQQRCLAMVTQQFIEAQENSTRHSADAYIAGQQDERERQEARMKAVPLYVDAGSRRQAVIRAAHKQALVRLGGALEVAAPKPKPAHWPQLRVFSQRGH